MSIIEDLAGDWRRPDERIGGLSTDITTLVEQDPACERLLTVPGIGPIISQIRMRENACDGVPTCLSVAPCSGPSRHGLETMEREASAERRPPFTAPCARRLPAPVGRGEETGFQAEQRNWDEGSGECREIVLDFESLIQGLLGVHSRYGLHTRAVTNS